MKCFYKLISYISLCKKPNELFIAQISDTADQTSTPDKPNIINENAYISYLFKSYRGEFLLEAYEQDYSTLKKIKDTGTDLDYTPVFKKHDLAAIILEHEFYVSRSYQ